MKLKKDIVIPAGTEFGDAPQFVTHYGDWIEYVFAIGPDNHGMVTVPVEPNDPHFGEWFEMEDGK